MQITPSIVRQWGKSDAVRLPKHFLETLGLQTNDKIDIILDEKEIIIRPAKDLPQSLDELFKDYDGSYQCCEWDTGEAIGKEFF